SNSDPSDDARTYYESLDMSSPMSAAEAFVEAFDADDYMAVWMLLDYFAQREIWTNINLLQYGQVIRSTNLPDRNALGDEMSATIGETTDRWYVFDRIMQLADANDALLIDVSPLSLTAGETTGDTADVVAELEGIEGEVIIRLSKSPKGNWRVRQVIVPGGDETQIPWSVPTDG
ncbi:MAG: hypothetical protein GY926_06000, partial [bacterium]|nr:hypothetical protein [bacterium]